MKVSAFLATLVASLSLVVLTACGGGGGSASAVVPSVQTCPDGTAVPSIGTASCPIVTSNAALIPAGSNNTQVTVSFNGTLDTVPSVTLSKGDGAAAVVVPGTWSLTGGNKVVMFTPTKRLTYDQVHALTVNATDSVGRTVKFAVPFTTPPMVCADNKIWSNPANYVAAYQDCVAPVGVQTMIGQSLNAFTDNSCVITVGTPLIAACKDYMANGTIVLAETSISVKVYGTAVTWMVHVGTDKVSYITLISGDMPIATFAAPVPLTWVIGNSSGLTVAMTDGKKALVTVDANLQIVFTLL